MKKKHFLPLLFILTLFLTTYTIYGQSVMITTVVDGTLKNGGCDSGTGTTDPRFVEFYVDGTVNFTGYSMGFSPNGAGFVKKSLTGLGTISNQFVYIVASGDDTTFSDLFPGRTFINFAGTLNGNEALNIMNASDVVLDSFGLPSDVSASGDYDNPWNYRDSYAKRKDEIVANATYNNANWTFGGDNALDSPNNTCAALTAAVTIGSFSLKTTNWTGSVSSDWTDAGNWDNGVPTLGYNAVIPEVSTAPIIGASTGANVGDLTITESDGLTIESGGSLIVSGTSTGNINYKIHVADNKWHLLSSPVVGEQYNDTWVGTPNFVDTNGSNRGISTYDNTTDLDGNWDFSQTTTTGTFNSGIGYSMKRTSTGNFTFIGDFPDSDINVTISQGFGATNKWNFIGNPFPSYIKASELTTANSASLTDTHEFIYVWDNSENAGMGGYKAISGTDYIHTGQGFFVNADNSDVDNFSFREGLQSHQNGITFYKDHYPSIKLSLSDGTSLKNTQIKYETNSTKGLDPGFDAGTFTGAYTNFNIYSHLVSNSEGVDFMIQSLPDSDFESMIIPIGVEVTAGKEITFSSEALNLPTGLKVYLEDRQNGTFTRLDEPNSEYRITLKKAANGIGRFYLHTKTSSVLRTDSELLNSVKIYKTNDNSLQILGLNEGNTVVSLFNMLGKKVLQTSFEASTSNTISLPSLSTGVYMVKLQTLKGKTTKKIIID